MWGSNYYAWVFTAINNMLTANPGIFVSMGENMFRALATIMLAWFGIKIALGAGELADLLVQRSHRLDRRRAVPAGHQVVGRTGFQLSARPKGRAFFLLDFRRSCARATLLIRARSFRTGLHPMSGAGHPEYKGNPL